MLLILAVCKLCKLHELGEKGEKKIKNCMFISLFFITKSKNMSFKDDNLLKISYNQLKLEKLGKGRCGHVSILSLLE